MRIARVYYPVTSLGPGKRTGIWTAGCPRQCEGCISPEWQNIEAGAEVSVDEILHMIARLPEKPQGFTISGGEPFLQASQLAQLLKKLSQISDDIIVFTGYTYEELIGMNDHCVSTALSYCAVLIDGPYVKELHEEIGLRGSSNQRIHIFKNPEHYMDLESGNRSLQLIRYKDSIVTIGIP